MSYQDRSNASPFLGMKAPVVVASTAALTLSGEQTIDGIAVTDGDRVLYKDGTTDNGIYIVRTGAWERAPDWDGDGDVLTGTMVFVPRGTTNAGSLHYVSTTGNIIVGTTSVTFTQAASIVADFATQAQVNAGASASTLVAPSTLAGRPSFSAHKNGSAQASITSATPVKVTFTTELWDTGGFYASSTWTPPAGKYRISASLSFTSANGVDAETVELRLYKAGAIYQRAITRRSTVGVHNVLGTFIVDANGTDTFEVYAYKSGTGDGTIAGESYDTWFSGEAI